MQAAGDTASRPDRVRIRSWVVSEGACNQSRARRVKYQPVLSDSTWWLCQVPADQARVGLLAKHSKLPRSELDRKANTTDGSHDTTAHDRHPDAATVAASPNSAALQEVIIYGHSTLLYWWPAWVFGFAIAVLNAGQEKFLPTVAGGQPSSALGLTYLSILLLLIVFTNVRLRGINSVVALLTVAFVAVLLAWFGWWDDIAKLIPYLSVHMNTGFYLVFSSGLLIIWLMMFFVFDRLTYWRVRPGQMTEEHLIGGGAESFDTNGCNPEAQLGFLPRGAGSRCRRPQGDRGGRARGNDRDSQRHVR